MVPPVKSLTNDPLWVGSRGHDACARAEGREEHGSRFHVRDVLGMKDINIRFPPSGRSVDTTGGVPIPLEPAQKFLSATHINITQGAKDGIDRGREGGRASAALRLATTPLRVDAASPLSARSGWAAARRGHNGTAEGDV